MSTETKHGSPGVDKVVSPSRFTFSDNHIKTADLNTTPTKRRRINSASSSNSTPINPAPLTKASSSPSMNFTSFASSSFAMRRSSNPINKFGFRGSPVPARSPIPFLSPRQAPMSLRSPMSGSYLRQSMSLAPSPQNNNEDLMLITSMLKLLDRKKSLVTYLSQMNGVAGKIHSATKDSTSDKKLHDLLSASFKQRYAWVIVQLEKTSQSLTAGLTKLKTRRQEMAASSTTMHLPPTPLPLPPEHLQESNIHVASMARQRANQLISKCRADLLAGGRLPPFSPLARHSEHGGTQNLLRSCVSLMIMLQYGVASGSIPGDLEGVLKDIEPQNAENRVHYESIQQSLADMLGTVIKKANNPAPVP